MIAPEWSEHVSDRCVRNVWSSETREYQFEDTIYLSAGNYQTPTKSLGDSFVSINPNLAMTIIRSHY
jgi:hypothetical protein